MSNVIILGVEDQVDRLFDQLEVKQESDLNIDIDLEAMGNLAPKMSLKEHEEAMSHCLCPMCGQQLATTERYVLKAQAPGEEEKMWDCDSIGCAAKMLRRMYKETRGVTSSIKYISTKQPHQRSNELNLFAFDRVYDR